MGNRPVVPVTGSGLIRGSDFDETIIGSDLRDTILADSGCDVVYGRAGDDVIDGQNGDDVLYGQNGTDDIAGGDDDDYLFGGDNANPSGLLEELNGEDGDDVLVGGAGSDRLVGGDDRGSDADNDYLVGTDYRAAGSGEIDYLRGGRGADTFVLGEVKATIADGAQGDYREDELTGRQPNQKAYYRSNGRNDYAVIEDFRPGAQGDKIQLLAQAPRTEFGMFEYVVEESPFSNTPGQAIYLRTSRLRFVEPDLIAIVQFGGNSDRQLNLNARYMDYVSGSNLIPFPDPPPFPIPFELS